MILSGTPKDWSVGFNGTPLTSKLYLGASSLQDIDSATHVLDAITVAPRMGGLFGLGFVNPQPLPIVPKVSKVTSNENGTSSFVDADFKAMLFDGACIALGNTGTTTLTLDLTYSSPVRVNSMAPRPNPNCDVTANIAFSYAVNGTSIPGASYISGDKSSITTPIDMYTDTVRVNIVVTGTNVITTVRDLLPNIDDLNQGPTPSFGILLYPSQSTAFAISGLHTNAEGLFPGVDVFLKDAL